VRATDPEAMTRARAVFPDLQYSATHTKLRAEPTPPFTDGVEQYAGWIGNEFAAKWRVRW